MTRSSSTDVWLDFVELLAVLMLLAAVAIVWAPEVVGAAL